jgi:hypothetical protein
MPVLLLAPKPVVERETLFLEMPVSGKRVAEPCLEMVWGE